MCQGAVPKDEEEGLEGWLAEHIEDPALVSTVAAGGWRYAALFYCGMFRKACEREVKQKQKIAQLEAEVRDLNHKLFGRKSESRKGSEKADAQSGGHNGQTGGGPRDRSTRGRGAQPGHRGHPRKQRGDLRVAKEVLRLRDGQKCCAKCGEPYGQFPPRRCSRIEYRITIFEVEFECERAVKSCRCPGQPSFVEATPPPTVIPKSAYGTSVWLEVLLSKYYLQHPTNHFARDWGLREVEISTGVLAGGLKRLQPLFDPVYDLIVERNQVAGFWNADETGWPVFGQPRQEHGRRRWQLWVFRARDAVVYIIRPSRGTEVPLEHFPEDVVGVFVVDRYSVYKKLANEYEGIILVFCWAHVRRDFLDAARKYEGLKSWTWAWIEEIGKLYKLKEARARRLQERIEDYPELCLEAKVEVVAGKEQSALRAQVKEMKDRWENQLREFEEQEESEVAEQSNSKASVKEKRQRRRELAHQKEKAKILRSLRRHWCGLTLFVDYPDIPLDNNAGERALRGAAVGRKNYYGSGSEWSIRLSESLFSLFATLEQCGINVRRWLSEYLEFCAKKRGKIPDKEEVKEWMPWNMSQEQRQRMSQPVAMPPPMAVLSRGEEDESGVDDISVKAR